MRHGAVWVTTAMCSLLFLDRAAHRTYLLFCGYIWRQNKRQDLCNPIPSIEQNAVYAFLSCVSYPRQDSIITITARMNKMFRMWAPHNQSFVKTSSSVQGEGIAAPGYGQPLGFAALQM